eukprot:TRINITY_DN5314_c0_g2_i1.p1 TRINITY_DN5314_c0_g2~~TRINITY_DN5314_c0_g2_i1.p1  ORF type:complete len:470 (-),score=164.21 TRINITY_DN5314_c0_g2_i1:80-1489(-)
MWKVEINIGLETNKRSLNSVSQIVKKVIAEKEKTEEFKKRSQNSLSPRKQKLIEDLTAENKKFLIRLEESEKEKAQLKDDLTKANITASYLNETMQALTLKAIEDKEKIKQLETDNSDLSNRIMHKKQEDAMKMSEIEQFFDDLLTTFSNFSTNSSSDLPKTTLHVSEITIEPWEIPTIKRKSFVGHSDEINYVTFFPNSNLFATGSNDKTVKIWDLKSGDEKKILKGASQAVASLAISQNNEFILAGCNDNSLRLWTNQGVLRHTLSHISKVSACTFMTDTQKAISTSYDRSIRCWDLNKGMCLKNIFAISPCTDLCLLPNSTTAITSHIDGNIRFWDLRTSDCTFTNQFHSRQITSLSLVNDFLLTNSTDNTLNLIEIRKMGVLRNLRHENYATGLNWSRACLSPQGMYTAAGGSNGGIFIWNNANGELEQVLREFSGTVSCVAWSSNGRNLIACDRNGQIITWECY